MFCAVFPYCFLFPSGFRYEMIGCFLFFLEGINAQCHTGETVLMLALKDGQVWILIPGFVGVTAESRLRNVWDAMIGIYE